MRRVDKKKTALRQSFLLYQQICEDYSILGCLLVSHHTDAAYLPA